MKQMNSVEIAVGKIGSKNQVARLIGVSGVAVLKWCKAGEVPFTHLIEFCKVTNTKPQDVNKTASELFKLWK